MVHKLSPGFRLLLEQSSPITTEEEQELGRIIRDSKEPEKVAEARNMLVMANLRYLVTVCTTEYYIKPPMELQDVINAGIEGYYEAAKRYDPDRGFNFTTYAKYWAKQKINSYIQTMGTIAYVPSGTIYQVETLRQTASELEQIEGRDIEIWELAERMGLEGDKLNSASNAMHYSDYNEQDSDHPYGLLYEDPEYSLAESIKPQLMAAINGLPPREKDIICRRFGMNCPRHTLREIGIFHMLSRERVRQITGKVLERLKRALDPPRPSSIIHPRRSSSSPPSLSSKPSMSLASSRCWYPHSSGGRGLLCITHGSSFLSIFITHG